jgi:hypothetical protein
MLARDDDRERDREPDPAGERPTSGAAGPGRGPGGLYMGAWPIYGLYMGAWQGPGGQLAGGAAGRASTALLRQVYFTSQSF